MESKKIKINLIALIFVVILIIAMVIGIVFVAKKYNSQPNKEEKISQVTTKYR